MEAPPVKKYSKKKVIKTLNSFDDLVKEDLSNCDIVIHGMTINEYDTDWMPILTILFGDGDKSNFSGLIKWYNHGRKKFVLKNKLDIYLFKNSGHWSFQNTLNDIYSSEVFGEDVDEYDDGDRVWHPFKLTRIDLIEK